MYIYIYIYKIDDVYTVRTYIIPAISTYDDDGAVDAEHSIETMT